MSESPETQGLVPFQLEAIAREMGKLDRLCTYPPDHLGDYERLILEDWGIERQAGDDDDWFKSGGSLALEWYDSLGDPEYDIQEGTPVQIRATWRVHLGPPEIQLVWNSHEPDDLEIRATESGVILASLKAGFATLTDVIVDEVLSDTGYEP